MRSWMSGIPRVPIQERESINEQLTIARSRNGKKKKK